MQIKLQGDTPLTPVRMYVVKWKLIDVGKDVDTWNFCTLLVRMENGIAIMGNSMQDLQKINNKTSKNASITLWIHIQRR